MTRIKIKRRFDPSGYGPHVEVEEWRFIPDESHTPRQGIDFEREVHEQLVREGLADGCGHWYTPDMELAHRRKAEIEAELREKYNLEIRTSLIAGEEIDVEEILGKRVASELKAGCGAETIRRLVNDFPDLGENDYDIAVDLKVRHIGRLGD